MLVVFVRHRPAFHWTALGAACLLTSHAIFWLLVEPVNETLLPLTAQTLPADWASLRQQWEYAHATRAVLQILGLAFLLTSVLVEVPAVVPERSNEVEPAPGQANARAVR